MKSIVDAFAGMETLMTIGAFLSSPAGLASLAILAGAGLAAFVGQKLQNLLEDKEEKSDFEKGGQKASQEYIIKTIGELEGNMLITQWNGIVKPKFKAND